MRSMFLIARKDLRSFFYSPIAYVVTAMFLLIVGWMFSSQFSYYAMLLQQYGATNAGEAPKLTNEVLRPLYGNVNIILLFVAPFVTMRLLAEEAKDHTLELLLTAPIRSLDIVLGKFLGGLGVLATIIAFTLVYPTILYFIAQPDWGAVIGCYVGMFFVAATYVAVGLFWSSCTENQIIAACLTFGTLLFFWLISWSAHRAGPVLSEFLNGLSLIGHYNNFSLGLIDTTDIVFYLSFTGFALFLTNLSMERS